MRQWILVCVAKVWVAKALVTVPLTGCVVTAVDPEDDRLTRSPVYFGEVAVGDTKQRFQLLFDTGSSNFWLPSDACSAKPCELHQRFTPSRPVKPGDLPGIATTFSTGQLVGFAVNDSICLGGSLCTDLVVMAAVQESDYPFISMPFDGIFGLGPSQDGPIRALQRSGVGAFAFLLGAPDCSVSGQAAFAPSVDDLPHWASSSTWAPLMQGAEESGYWMVELLSVSLGGRIIDGNGSFTSCNAVLDTGSGDLMGPQEQVDAVLDALQGKEGCEFTGLPNLQFQVRGMDRNFMLELQGEDYMRSCQAELSTVSVPGKPRLWVLGQPLLRKYGTVYDLRRSRVGFAKRRQLRQLRGTAGAALSPGSFS